MVLKSELMDDKSIKRTLTRLAHEIVEKNKGAQELVLIGIKRRGYPIAKRLSELIYDFEGVKVPVGAIDITWYRDDLKKVSEEPKLKDENLMISVENKKIILVDDVIYTGRTSRAAIDAVIDSGRPKMIQLCVLIDRGHRELPIRPDYVGKNIPTAKNELVSVELLEIDNNDSVKIYEQ